MPCLIADSGPLIALAKLGQLDLPARLFGRAVLPETVFAECVVQAGLDDARAIRAAVDSGSLEVMADVPWSVGADLPRLDPGELAVLSLASQLAGTVLIDERRGRDAAHRLGLPVVGACGLLLQATRLGWLGPLAPLLAQLQREGYYISPGLTAKILALAGER